MLARKNQVSLAYLVSQYPAVSHTFILNEVKALRDMGVTIDVASINNADIPPGKNTEVEVQEQRLCYYIKQEGILRGSVALFQTLLSHPKGFLLAWKKVFSLAGFDLKKILYHHFYLGEAALLGQWMLQKEKTHVHVHFGNAASTVALLATELFPLTYSVSIHGPDIFYDTAGLSLKEKMEGACLVTCISHFARSQVIRLLDEREWKKVKVAPLGVDTKNFSPMPKNKENDLIKIVNVGRLVPIKGQLILIQAVSELVKKGHLIHLFLVGGGPSQKELERNIRQLGLSKEVTLTGAVNQTVVKEHLGTADIFVTTSFAEGVPIVLMEAMAMKVPSVASRINGIPELINDGHDGLLFPPSDVETLVSVLEKLIRDRPLRETIGQNGREKVLKDYDLKNNISHLHKIFEQELGCKNV